MRLSTSGRTYRAVRIHPVVGFIAAVGVAVTLVASPQVAAAPRTAAASDRERGKPNIILFLTDDQSLADMEALHYVSRRIGRHGTTFTRSFSQYPLCCPARATLITGQYAHNHGVMGNEPPHGGFDRFRDRETLPVWLRRAGYNTVMLSKYLNGYDKGTRYVPPGWTNWQAPVSDIYDYRNFTMNENGRLVRYHDYQTSHWQHRGASLIRRYAARRKPFFLWAGFLAPHAGTPIERDDPMAKKRGGLPTPGVAREFRNALAGTRLPDKPSFMEPDMSDKPGLRGRTHRPRREFREAHQQRLESLLSVDKAVRAMLKALDRTGEAERTVVIFTSDNGHLMGEHRRFSKTVGYEESARVPFLVSGPGFSAGVARDQLVSLADIASTIAKAAGARTRLVQDGRPLQRLSADPRAGSDRAILLEAGPAGRTHGRRLYTGIRTPDDRVLLRWWSGATELYNLSEDPFQLDGTIGTGETREEHDLLSARLDELQDCAGAACR